MTSLTDRANKLLARVSNHEFRRADESETPSPVEEPQAKAPKPRRLPPPDLPVGGAISSDFFDAYPRFFTTSKTTPHPTRLNLRYEAIFTQNREVFDGASVLDIASHDGRWSFAALQSGASSVIGIEGRPELVAKAEQNLTSYGIDRSRFRFVGGDVFEVLRNEDIQVDVVMCLGFMYHTLRYNELMHLMAECHPKFLVIDTEIARSREPIIRVKTEGTARQGNAIADQYTYGNRVLLGKPSASGLVTIAGAYGFELERRSDWAALLRDNDVDNTIASYRLGRRATFCFRS